MKQEFWITSCTGVQLYTAKWLDETRQNYKGIIQLVHGMQEHIGRYEEFAKILVEQGYIVVAHDQLGHGKTVTKEEEFGYFAKKNGWEKLVEDIHIIQNKIQNEYLRNSLYPYGT